jgi:hypothetical protein
MAVLLAFIIITEIGGIEVNMKTRTINKIIVILILSILNTSLLSVNIKTEITHAQAGQGYFEGDIPIRGSYLQAINCYPLIPQDSDEDGILDVGFSWDWDGDGQAESNQVEEPLIVDLEANGFKPGDEIMISYKQSIHDTNNVWWWFYVFGLFSSTDELLTDDWVYNNKWPMVGPLNRVPGAIDAALGGYEHQSLDNTNIWKQGREVEDDIPEDFFIGTNGFWYSNPTYNPDGGPWNPNAYSSITGFWIKIPPSAKFLFLQLNGVWRVSDYGECTIIIDKDSDGDAIPDSWEKNGIDINLDGNIDLTLNDADYEHKDIYVEVDYMNGRPFHSGAQHDVKRAFANAPVDNPDNSIGINLHIDIDELLPYREALNLDNKWTDYYEIKEDHFGTGLERTDPMTIIAKKRIYHYCLFINHFAKWNATSGSWQTKLNSGIAERPGNDLIVSLGTPTLQDRMYQSATFMHELGHNLGLRHGGNDTTNHKPNYLSIMNYLFQFTFDVPGRPLDFSWVELPSLIEDDLDENLGVQGQNLARTAYTLPDGTKKIVFLNDPLDWNGDGDTTDNNAFGNINNFKGNSPQGEVLTGYADWDNLVYRFTDKSAFSDGAPVDVVDDEITTLELETMYQEALAHHEVAIRTITEPVETDPQQFELNFTLVNFGWNQESVEIHLHADESLLKSETVDIVGGDIINATIEFSTSSLNSGSYSLVVSAEPVQDETNTEDNSVSIEFRIEGEETTDFTTYYILILAAVVAIVVLIWYMRMRK